ncbi:MAG TPA: hypothetical protein DEP51_05885 [Clostridiales bacterium]|nr:hypothetical protein [Clostridiales bacterium]
MNNDVLSNNTVNHIKAENIEYLQFKKLQKYNNIISHSYSVGIDRDFRTFKPNREPLLNSEYENSINNYKMLCNQIGANYKNIIKACQAHTDNIVSVDKISTDGTIDTKILSDGLITNKRGIVLATTNADCILFLFFDPVKKVIANTHSGWKGTLQEISIKTVEKMINIYGCNPKDIIVCICPSIRKCHFEVGEDVKEMFYNQFKKLGNTDEFIFNRHEKWYVDTVYINKMLLKGMGVLEDNIEDSGICSVCNSNIIHSYRVEGENYRLATALIGLR